MNTFQVLENSIPPKTYAIVVRFDKVTEGENPCPCGGRCHDVEIFENRRCSVYWCEHYQGTRHEPSVSHHAKGKEGGKLTILCNVEAVMKAQEEKNKKLDEKVMEEIESSILEIKAEVERAMDYQEILNKLKEAGSKE